jgi:hypothetical protein
MLGIPTSCDPKFDVIDVFNDALTKFIATCKKAQLLSKMTTDMKINFINSFAYPILLHVGKFYLLPISQVKIVESVVRSFLTPKWSSVPLAILKGNRQCGGLFTRLVDFQARNAAAVITTLLPAFYKMYSGAPSDYSWHSLHPFGQLTIALKKYGPFPMDICRPTEGVLQLQQAQIYQHILLKREVDVEAENKLRICMKRRSGFFLRGHMKNYKIAIKSIPKKGYISAFRMHRWATCNALPVAERFAWSKNYVSGTTCAFCHLHPETLKHLLAECPTTIEGVQKIHNALHLPFHQDDWNFKNLMRLNHKYLPPKISLLIADSIIRVWYVCKYNLLQIEDKSELIVRHFYTKHLGSVT